MTKSALGIASLAALGSGLALMIHLAIWSPYGGHSVAREALLAFFLVGLGVILGLGYLIRRSLRKRRG